jgi:hypothetical protein
MDNQVINHCKDREAYNPKTNGKNSWFRQEWFKCVIGWFTGMKISALVPLVQAMVNFSACLML